MGLQAETIGGGGTGTYENEAASARLHRAAGGSYIFMDADYARNKRADGGSFDAYEHALFVLCHRHERAGAGAARASMRA